MIKKDFKRRIVGMLLVVIMLLGTNSFAFATNASELESAVNDTAQFMYKEVKTPQVGSIGGEWAVLGLARSGYKVSNEYYQRYYKTIEEYVKACNGNLHDKKYTEYSRIIVALSSIGKDARNVAGYDLTKALGDYDKTIWQGLNGPIWALISLDSGNYPMPTNADAKVQATRAMYVQRILDCQLSDGGWSLFGGTSAASSGDGISDPDITGMALQALAKYQDNSKVKKACDEALACMSKMQNKEGGFSSWGTPNSESTVQMIVAITELGLKIDDPRFVKNGKTMLDNLMTFYKKGEGFLHTDDGSGSNQMASEQGFYGLVASDRAMKGKNSLYRMSDAIKPLGDGSKVTVVKQNEGLEEKNEKINMSKVIKPGMTFEDVQAHKNQPAIEGMASRGIINGKTDKLFDPGNTMTRAEFAIIVVKALGLEPMENNKFTDVKSGSWYSGYVGTANQYGIVNGKTETSFDPQGTITREEAASMISRAAKLCGMDTEYDNMAARDILAGFDDYVKCSSWAQSPLAFCYDKGILDDSAIQILPKDAIKRCEVAQMLFNMLGAAKLI